MLVFLVFFSVPSVVEAYSTTNLQGWLSSLKAKQTSVTNPCTISQGTSPTIQWNANYLWWGCNGSNYNDPYFTVCTQGVECTMVTPAHLPMTWDPVFGNFHNADYSRWTLAAGYIDINYFDDQALTLNGFIWNGTGAVSVTNPPTSGVPSSDLPLKDMRCAVMGIHLQSEYGGSGGAGLTCYAEGKVSGTTYQIPIPLLAQATDENIAAFFAKQRHDGVTMYDMKDMQNRTFLETIIGWGGTAKTVISTETTKWGSREVLADGSIRLQFNSDNASGTVFQTSNDMQARLVAEVPGIHVNTTGLLPADGSTTQTQALVGAMRELNNTLSGFNGGAGPGEPVKFQVTTGQTDTHVPGAAQTDATTVKAIGTMTGNNYGDIIALGKPVTAQTALDSVNSANAKFGGTVARQFEYTGSNAPSTTVSNTPPSSSGSGSSGAGLPTGNAPVAGSGVVGTHTGMGGVGSGVGVDGVTSSLYSSSYSAWGGTFRERLNHALNYSTNGEAFGNDFGGRIRVQEESLTFPVYCFDFIIGHSTHHFCLDFARYSTQLFIIGTFVMVMASFVSYEIIMG